MSVPEDFLAPAPPSLDLVHAAALPIAGLTAWQSLVGTAGVRPGQRVLVRAAAGGVGHLAVQIAKSQGAFSGHPHPDGTLLDIRGTGPDRTAVRELARGRGLRYVEFGFTPSGADLREVTALVERGVLRVVVEHVLPVAEAAKAHVLSETGRVTGKIVLAVA